MKRGRSEVLGFLSAAASVQFFGNILSGSLDLLCKESHYPETVIQRGHVEALWSTVPAQPRLPATPILAKS